MKVVDLFDARSTRHNSYDAVNVFTLIFYLFIADNGQRKIVKGTPISELNEKVWPLILKSLVDLSYYTTISKELVDNKFLTSPYFLKRAEFVYYFNLKIKKQKSLRPSEVCFLEIVQGIAYIYSKECSYQELKNLLGKDIATKEEILKVIEHDESGYDEKIQVLKAEIERNEVTFEQLVMNKECYSQKYKGLAKRLDQ